MKLRHNLDFSNNIRIQFRQRPQESSIRDDPRFPRRSERTAAVPAPRSRAEIAAYFAQQGYAVVYQDCRGRYKSGGRFTKYLSEAEYGYDTLAWVMRQRWCNGRIGTFGLSYAAHTQAALGCLDPPGLAAQFLDCGGFSNAYRSGIRHDGAFDLKQATWAYNNALADAKDPAVRAALKAQDIGAWFARMPWRKGDLPVSAAPEYEDYLFGNGRMGCLTRSGSSPAFMRKGFGQQIRRCAGDPSLRLVRSLRPDRGRKLSRAVKAWAFIAAADSRPWSRRPLAELCREVDFGPAAPVRQSRPRFRRTAPHMDRLLGQGREAYGKFRPSLPCRSLSWAAAPGREMSLAGSITAASGAVLRHGHCRRPSTHGTDEHGEDPTEP